MKSLFIVESSYFTAGFEAENNKVVRAAPIIKYFVGWCIDTVIAYCKKKNFKIIYYGKST
jgi:hypothetical protein